MDISVGGAHGRPGASTRCLDAVALPTYNAWIPSLETIKVPDPIVSLGKDTGEYVGRVLSPNRNNWFDCFTAGDRAGC